MYEPIDLADLCARVKVIGRADMTSKEFLAALKAELDAIREDLYDSLEELEDIQAELDEDAEL